MKTEVPLILTATVAPEDLAPFDALRRLHFTPDRNHLRAHLTMFHRLPGEKEAALLPVLEAACRESGPISAEVSGLRHLGAGVAFRVASPELEGLHAGLKTRFASWLNPQDAQRWQPHITIQNKVTREKADLLFEDLSADFEPHRISITGVDLWLYKGGPWEHRAHLPFVAALPVTRDPD